MSHNALTVLLTAYLAASTAAAAAVATAAGTFNAGSVDPASVEALLKSARERRNGFVLDTTSPNWKPISDDVGLWITEDDRIGLRARLYVKLGGTWQPVATDGPADLLRMFPAR